MNRLETYTSDIIKLCDSHKVKSLYAFDSVLTDDFNKESDIDLIVDFSNIAVEDCSLPSSVRSVEYITISTLPYNQSYNASTA
jgi:predicted nucleotidyltransferase